MEILEAIRGTCANRLEEIHPIIVSTGGKLINVISLHRQCIEGYIGTYLVGRREAIDASYAVKMFERLLPRIFYLYFTADNIYLCIYLIRTSSTNYNYP